MCVPCDLLQEIMYRAAKFVAHARKLTLDLGRNFNWL